MRGVDVPKVVVASIMVLALLMTLSWLQGRFDTSDHKKATALVRDYRPQAGGRSIADVIAARHSPVTPDELSWSSEILSGCLGHVRVTAYVPGRAHHASLSYSFDARLTDSSIHPTDEATIELLKSLTGTSATASPPK